MKRITLIILSVAAILAGSVSCQKVNDLDKRLTQLEQTVSDLKAQVLAGAVITSVDKTDDGCTFTLSNGQSYTVTNGKNGSDGEAIIADVKIEEDFIVLTLKDGETLRISYQNPLSMVTLDIVPDFDDGTVKEPKTSEAMGIKSTNFYLDISVTPAKYAEILSDTERFIHKAVFSPVQTKSGFGNAFTVSPKRVTYCEGAPIPFLQASFELDDESAAVLQNTPYTVSYSIEDKDGVHGAATAFVTISHEKGSAPDVPNDEAFAAVDLGLSVKWANMNLGASSSRGSGHYYAWGATEPYYSGTPDNPTSWIKEGGYIWQNAPFNSGSSEFNSSYFSEHKSEFVDENDVLLPGFDAAHVKLGDGWRMPTEAEFQELINNCEFESDEVIIGKQYYRFMRFTSNKTGNSIIFPMQLYYDGIEQMGYSYVKTNTDGSKYVETLTSYYWSSTYKNKSYAHSLYLNKYDHQYSFGMGMDLVRELHSYRYLVGQDLRYGCPIRPVYDKSRR